MLGRLLLSTTLVLSGVGALPHHAQAQSTTVRPPIRWVYVCRYSGSSDGRGVETAPFSLADTSKDKQLENEFLAWYRANGGASDASLFNVYCSTAPESDLGRMQQTIKPDERLARSSWIPPYGLPYKPPTDFYFYCYAPEQGLQRRFFTDLFKTPMPENIPRYLEQAHSAHVTWMRGQGMNYYPTNARCESAPPEAFWHYAVTLDAYGQVTDPSRPYRLTRSAWPGIAPKAAPNLIDDLEARARYAKMRITAPVAPTKAAPPSTPPSAPKPKPPTAPSSAGSLTVKTDTSLRDAGKAWDEQVKKTLAEEARKKVELAAKQVQIDAKAKADTEAFFKARRRQGSAQ